MSFNTLLSDALSELETTLQFMEETQVFTWVNGAEIPCTPNNLDAATALEIGGHADTSGLRLFVRRDHFLTADSTLVTADSELYTADNDTRRPVAGLKLQFRGKTWRIISAREDASRAFFVLTVVASQVAFSEELTQVNYVELQAIASQTRAQRDASTPVQGQLIFQSDSTPGIRIYLSGTWRKLVAVGVRTPPTGATTAWLNCTSVADP